MKYLIIIFCFLSSLSAKEKYLYDMSGLPHVLVNLQKGYVAFKLSNKTVYKKLNDPEYLTALKSGQLDRLLRSSELTLDSKGFFPLPVKIANIIEQKRVGQAGIAQDYMVLAHYLSTPLADSVSSLTDVSYFIKAVKTNSLEVRGLPTNYEELVDRKDAYVYSQVNKDFPEEIPEANDFKEWMRNFLNLNYADKQDLLDCEDLDEVENMFLVVSEEKRRKSLKTENSKILTKLLLAGYPMILEQKDRGYIVTAVFKEHVYVYHHGQQYIGTLKKLLSKKVENSISLFKIDRHEDGTIKTALDDHFDLPKAEVLPPAPVVPAPEVQRSSKEVTLLTFADLIKDSEKYQERYVLFSCKLEDMKFSSKLGVVFFKSKGHYFRIGPVSSGFVEFMKNKVTAFKRRYAKQGDAAYKDIQKVYFKGKFKIVSPKKELLFDEFECVNYDLRMKTIPTIGTDFKK